MKPVPAIKTRQPLRHCAHGKHALSITSTERTPLRKRYPIAIQIREWGSRGVTHITVKQALAFAARLNKAARLAAALARRP